MQPVSAPTIAAAPAGAVALDATGLDEGALVARFAALADQRVRALVLRGAGNRSLRALAMLGSLRHLEIIDPMLDRLPNELGQLRTLRLECFRLLSLPRAIGRLRTLVELYVDSHHLSHLPDEVRRLARLRALGLVIRDYYNGDDWDWERHVFVKAAFRQSLPDLFRLLAGLPMLQTLLLGEPPRQMWHVRCPPKLVDELPAELALLARLETLIFVECPKVSLPDEVRTMPHLRRIVARQSVVERRPWLRSVGDHGDLEIDRGEP